MIDLFFFSCFFDLRFFFLTANKKKKKSTSTSTSKTTDPPSEKQTRGSLRSAVDRALSSSKPPPAVVVDGCNSVKGFRYELWCLGRSARARYCCVSCPESGSSSSGNDRNGVEGEPSSGFVGRWPRALFDDLAARVEPPDPRNRWEQPLFLADARRRETERAAMKTEGGGGGGGRESVVAVRPAPASLPAGGRGGSIEETRGWPLDAVVAAVVAAVGPAKSGKKQQQEEEEEEKTTRTTLDDDGDGDNDTNDHAEPETLPLATTSIALRPAKCTLTARVAGADALGDLDAAAQAVLLAVAAAAKRAKNITSSSSSTAAAAAATTTTVIPSLTESTHSFAAIEIPLPVESKAEVKAEKQQRRQEEPLTLSLQRAPSLAELRRHKRDFLRAATAPMAGPLPAGMRAGASAFCEYLKRRVV